MKATYGLAPHPCYSGLARIDRQSNMDPDKATECLALIQRALMLIDTSGRPEDMVAAARLSGVGHEIALTYQLPWTEEYSQRDASSM